MPHATFVSPDLTTFTRLDELGLEVVGQFLEPARAVLACRVVDLTCTLLVTCAVEHVGYVVGGHGLGLELSAGQSDGDVLQGA